MYTKKIVDGYVEKTVTYDKRLKYCPIWFLWRGI